jgi:glutaredoxin
VSHPPRVILYSRTTCGLCDEARETILAIRDENHFEYEEIFVDGRDDLERAYGLRVPVILIDGQERFELHVDPADLRGALDGA